MNSPWLLLVVGAVLGWLLDVFFGSALRRRVEASIDRRSTRKRLAREARDAAYKARVALLAASPSLFIMERTRLAAIAGWRATVGVGALVISATVLIVSEVSALGDYPDWLVAASRVLAGLGFVVGSVMVSGAVAAAEDLASVASSLSDLGGEGAAD